jgi:hypothetical protein
MDDKKLQELNLYLKKVYKCTRSLFNKIDKNLYFNLNNENLIIDLFGRGFINEIHLAAYHKRGTINFPNPFSFYCTKIQCSFNKTIALNHTVYVGLYFPYHNIGDEIEITYQYYGFHKYIIKITDTNKVYLPYKNYQFIIQHGLSTHYIKGHNGKPFYSINLVPTSYVFDNCLCHERKIYFNLTYVEEASAEIIQKAWRNYRRRKTLNAWKSNIEDVNNEIKYMPDFGINYYEAMNDFKTLI